MSPILFKSYTLHPADVASTWIVLGMMSAIAVSLGCDREIQSITSRPVPSREETVEPSAPEVPPEHTIGNKSATARSVTMRIEVSGFSNDEGSCMLAIYKGSAHFNDPEFAIAKQSISIKETKAVWQMELSIPQATESDSRDSLRFSVSAYHDGNANSRLDKNAFGIPTERYGFSRNPNRGYGPPSFSETAMDLGQSPSGDAVLILEVPIQIK
jgi:uncharacterized protein (DUF2141 family)